MAEPTGAIKLIRLIGTLNDWVAKVVSYLIVVMVATICYEVLCRYFLNAPTDWANELNQYLLCGLSMLGGGYCLLQDQHVRVDVVYMHFSVRRRAVVELATWWLVLLFSGVMLCWGGEWAWEALVNDKRSMSLLEWPLYPSMAMVPLGAFLILIQTVARLMGHVLILKSSGERREQLLEALNSGKPIFE